MKKLPLDYIKTFGSTVGDTHFSKVTALFNFDGSDGDTTTSGLDSSNKNLTVSYSSGDQLSNTQKKFGATSLYVADNVTISSSDGFNMGTGDFTIEAWYYFTSFSNSFGIYDQYAGSGTGTGNSQLWFSPSASSLRVYYNGNNKFELSGTFSTGQWYHIAVVRSSGTIKVYVNGTADSTTQSYTGQFGKTGTLYLGDQHAGGGGAPQYYIDDLRVTKGLARYTSNFTAPTTAHLTSAGDSLKNIIVNEDADGIIIGTSGINASRIAKAWAHFDGTGPTVNGSYNISSITDSAVGKFTANFSEAMADTNYTMHVQGGDGTGPSSPYIVSGRPGAFATGSCPFHVVYVGGSGPSAGWYDYTDIVITFFGN